MKMLTVLPKLKPIAKRRLRKLIAFLRQLPRRKFDFSTVINDCHTIGCAVGWCPVVFPKLCRFGDRNACENWVVVKSVKPRRSRYSVDDVTSKLLMLPEEHASLFRPNRAQLLHSSLADLHGGATPKQVAAMLEKYITFTETPLRP